MIKGIQAFEACWMNLRASHPTGPAQNLMIAQAMGKVTDCYETAEEVEQTLPTDLQVLFRTLIHAYFHGYAVAKPPAAKSSRRAIASRNQSVPLTQTARRGERGPKAVVAEKRQQPNPSSQNAGRSRQNFWGANRNEAETLIIEFPGLD